jgi:hypothetical protein
VDDQRPILRLRIEGDSAEDRDIGETLDVALGMDAGVQRLPGQRQRDPERQPHDQPKGDVELVTGARRGIGDFRLLHKRKPDGRGHGRARGLDSLHDHAQLVGDRGRQLCRAGRVPIGHGDVDDGRVEGNRGGHVGTQFLGRDVELETLDNGLEHHSRGDEVGVSLDALNRERVPLLEVCGAGCAGGRDEDLRGCGVGRRGQERIGHRGARGDHGDQGHQDPVPAEDPHVVVGFHERSPFRSSAGWVAHGRRPAHDGTDRPSAGLVRRVPRALSHYSETTMNLGGRSRTVAPLAVSREPMYGAAGWARKYVRRLAISDAFVISATLVGADSAGTRSNASPGQPRPPTPS